MKSRGFSRTGGTTDSTSWRSEVVVPDLVVSVIVCEEEVYSTEPKPSMFWRGVRKDNGLPVV